MKKHGKKNSGSPLSYHDYLGIFCFWDSEWSKERPSEVPDNKGVDRNNTNSSEERNSSILKMSFYDKARFITERCYDYLRGLEKNYQKFCKANSMDIPPEKAAYDHYYYNPVNYITFGHSDNLSIILLDDFDPVHHITAAPRTTIEDVILTFCPKIESLNLQESELANYKTIIEELGISKSHREIFNYTKLFTELHSNIKNFQDFRSQIHINQHSFQDENPLLVFTKFKTASQGLTFQYALFRAIVMKIVLLCAKLDELLEEESTDKQLFFSKEDLNSGRITLLDMQGHEEVGLLFFCKNYSWAVTLISALRTLTWNDLFIADNLNTLQSNVDISVIKKVNIDIAWNNIHKKDAEQRNKPNSINDNHVFLYTHTTLAISPREFIDPKDLNKINGYVEAFTEFQIAPGHNKGFQNQVLGLKNIDQDLKIQFDPDSYSQYNIGVTDFMFLHNKKGLNSNVEHDLNGLIPLSHAINNLRSLIIEFGSLDPTTDSGRTVIDLITHFTIPIPKIFDTKGKDIIYKEIGTDHCSLLAESLSIIKKNLFYYSDNEDDRSIKQPLLRNPGNLDILKLHKVPIKYGLPISLRRNIEYLYQNLATLFGDPYYYNSVLDLYDAFTAYHFLLCNELEDKIYKENAKKANHDVLYYIDFQQVEKLSSILNALHDSILHKISKTYPQSNYRDMSIDFRGGLNQILFAADAPIKSSLDILKSTLIDENTSEQIYLGGIIRIGFMPGATIETCNFSYKNKIIIAPFELDVPHVLHITSYIDNIHEVGHIIFEILKNSKKFDTFISTLNEIEEYRINEIFAMLFCYLLIFPDNKAKFIYYQISNYSKDLISTEKSDKGIVIKFTEFLIELFIVTDCIEDGYFHKKAKVDLNDRRYYATNALVRFEKMVEEYGPFFSDYNRLFEQRNEGKEYFYAQFPDIYRRAMVVFNDVLVNVIDIVNRYRDFGDLVNDSMIKQLDLSINECIVQGKPLVQKDVIKSLIQKEEQNKYSKTITDLLISRCLNNYIPDPVSNNLFKKEIHLKRKVSSREIEYPKGAKEWCEFQIDKGYSSMFSPVPVARKRRLRKQIALVKTLWDIAATQRQNILEEIILDNWVEE